MCLCFKSTKIVVRRFEFTDLKAEQQCKKEFPQVYIEYPAIKLLLLTSCEAFSYSNVFFLTSSLLFRDRTQLFLPTYVDLVAVCHCCFLVSTSAIGMHPNVSHPFVCWCEICLTISKLV